MTWILVAGAVICCWAMLRTMGSERERRALELRAAAATPPPAAPAPLPQPPAPTKRLRPSAFQKPTAPPTRPRSRQAA